MKRTRVCARQAAAKKKIYNAQYYADPAHKQRLQELARRRAKAKRDRVLIENEKAERADVQCELKMQQLSELAFLNEEKMAHYISAVADFVRFRGGMRIFLNSDLVKSLATGKRIKSSSPSRGMSFWHALSLVCHGTNSRSSPRAS
jgi:hypothetical protein